MVKLLSIFVLLAAPISCMFTSKRDPQLKVVLMRIPFPRWDGISKVVEQTDTVWFIKNGNTNVFKMPGLREVVDDNFLNPVIREYKYFIYNDNDSMGLLFDSAIAVTGVRKRIDSFFARKFYGEIAPVNKFNVKINSFTEETGNTVDVYVLNNKPDRTYPDTTKLYYNARFNHLFYSFSKELDSVKGMKLFKFRFIYNADDPKKFNDPWPAKEFFWEIQEDTLLNKKEILDFIQRHKDQLHG